MPLLPFVGAVDAPLAPLTPPADSVSCARTSASLEPEASAEPPTAAGVESRVFGGDSVSVV
jgi:hypothetical protein